MVWSSIRQCGHCGVIYFSALGDVTGGDVVYFGATGGGVTCDGVTGGGAACDGETGGSVTCGGAAGGGVTGGGAAGGGATGGGVTGGGAAGGGVTGGGAAGGGVTSSTWEAKFHQMQKCMRYSSKFLETGGSNANVQFISSHKLLFYPIAPNEMHFCISIALKQKFAENQMHFCSSFKCEKRRSSFAPAFRLSSC
ncbi:hypothetical protein P4H94_20510 [Paenibacillus macerans]|uniref:hypothetical protein n=2 Tax=Paenibacillus TaxID=44249 RepID=UPI0022DEC9C1|nr:hypothetical protein [Paenibacillus macerans]MEC0139233.1 hypothetical protein [Paenibacillus macerans]